MDDLITKLFLFHYPVQIFLNPEDFFDSAYEVGVDAIRGDGIGHPFGRIGGRGELFIEITVGALDHEPD